MALGTIGKSKGLLQMSYSPPAIASAARAHQDRESRLVRALRLACESSSAVWFAAGALYSPPVSHYSSATCQDGFRGAPPLAYNIERMTGSSRASGGSNRAGSAGDGKARRILAIDYGRKRIGLALSDELGFTAQPLATLLRRNRRDDLRRLREICREHGVERILVGHPLHMTGAAGEMAEEAAQFAARLKKGIDIVVELVDERLTSWEADQLMAEWKPSSRRKRTHTDDIAAAILLREYLNRPRAQPRPARAEKE